MEVKFLNKILVESGRPGKTGYFDEQKSSMVYSKIQAPHLNAASCFGIFKRNTSSLLLLSCRSSLWVRH